MLADPFREMYLICATPRVGSTLFCHTLAATGAAGHPVDWLDENKEDELREELGRPAADRAELLAHTFASCRSAEGVGGMKIMWEQLDRVMADLREFAGMGDLPSGPERFGEAFRGSRAVHLSRRNKVRAAISYWLAITTGQWIWYGQKPQRSLDRDILLDARSWAVACWTITKMHSALHEGDLNWPIFLRSAGINATTVYYEDWTNDPAANVVGIANAALDLSLSGSIDPRAIRLSRQASEDNDLIERRWTEETGGCRYCQSPKTAAQAA